MLRQFTGRHKKHVGGSSEIGPPSDLIGDNQPVAMLYSAHVLSRLASLSLFWIPSFLLDIQHGSRPSSFFVVFNYLVCCGGFLLGAYLGYLVYETTLKLILPGLIESVFRLIASLVAVSLLSWILFGMFNLAYIIYHRDFVRQFFLHHANILRLPRCFQRRMACYVGVATFVSCFLMEAPFVAAGLMEGWRQPEFWPELSVASFWSLKVALILAIVWGTNMASLSCNMVAAVSRYLILASAKHLEASFEGQVRRLSNRSRRRQMTFEGQNKELVELANQQVVDLIRDYSIDTLTLDWPCEDLDDPEVDQKLDEPTIATTCRSSGLSVGSLLFLYKNLVRNLSELRAMIDIYEHKFGYFHLVSLVVTGLNVAQWAVTAITQARLVGRDLATHQHQIIVSMGYLFVTPFALRTVVATTSWFVSNTVVFLGCDCLRSRICKIQSRLFKMNVEMALDTIRKRKFAPNKAENWSELDQVWSLYEQVARMGQRANFRLTSSTYYHKNCLLMLLGREISLLLLYIQVVDIYIYI